MPFIDVLVSPAADRPPVASAELAATLTDLTANILRKRPDLTAVMIREIPPSDWFVGGRPLADLGAASHRVIIRVTSGTNTTEEKAAWIAAVSAEMKRLQGSTRPESYVMIDEVAAEDWGWDGETQAARRREARPGSTPPLGERENGPPSPPREASRRP